MSDLMPRKMPHVYNIHVKIFFKKCKRFHFRKLRTVIIFLFSVTRTQIDKNYGYTFLALSVSIIIIILRSSIRKYYQIGISICCIKKLEKINRDKLFWMVQLFSRIMFDVHAIRFPCKTSTKPYKI